MINPAAVNELYSKHSRRSKILFYATRVVDGGSFLSVGPEVYKRCSHVRSALVKVVPVPTIYQPHVFKMYGRAESFRPHHDIWVDSASNRNEPKEYFLGVKAVGA
jgi:hypothetical protein